MRPHALRLTAFGPFPGEVEVDLDALAAGGLFLLHGQTGAGKTTLLDAMCFALYGAVPGARGSRRLRSDHAEAGVRCSVTLDLTVGGRRLRVTREPAYERPKKRGVGMRSEPATVRVEEQRGGIWSTWSTRPGEADLEIADLVGMSAEQFWQVVLLPQGQFAAFLHAKDGDRLELLERLFATHRFAAVEQWLSTRRRDLAGDLAAGRRELDALVARIAQASGVDLPEMPDTAWYDGTLADLDAVVTGARADAVAAGAAADAADAVHRRAEQTAARQTRRAAAEVALAALLAGADDVTTARGQLGAARRVAPLVPLADRADRSRLAAAEAAGRRVLDAAGQVVTADTAALAVARTTLGRLGALAPQADRARAHAERAAQAEIDRAAATALRSEVAIGLAAVPAVRLEATARHATALTATRDLPAAEAAVTRLTTLVADEATAVRLTAQLAEARTAETAARECLVGAGEERLALRTALLAGQAARLAAGLVDGEPCAVCGSAEHPAPTTGGGTVPADADLASADAAVARAEEVRGAAGARVAAFVAELAALGRRGWADVPDLAAAHAAAVAHLEACAAGAAELDDAAAAVAACDDLAAALGRDGARLEAVEAAAAVTRDEAAALAADDRAALAVALDGAADLATALAATSVRVDLLVAAAETAAEITRRAAAAADDAAVLATALAAADIPDAAAVHAGALAGTAADDLAALVGAYDGQLAAARATLADPELQDTPTEPVDVAAAGVVAAERARVRDELADLVAVAADRHRSVTALGPGLRALLAALAPLLAEHDEVSGLAELTRGANPRGMPLSTYVLAARLEQVAATASQRLQAMTDGRYTLRHTDVRADKRSRGGLGLTVHDAWTGAVRDTGTLSGGETFIASLALALGLADTVTAEAGGAPIEALFVDEGFGSLDEETLEEVMDVLDALRSGGRVVGVVSHVPDLRRRIPAQLHVRKGRAGSTLELIGA